MIIVIWFHDDATIFVINNKYVHGLSEENDKLGKKKNRRVRERERGSQSVSQRASNSIYYVFQPVST